MESWRYHPNGICPVRCCERLQNMRTMVRSVNTGFPAMNSLWCISAVGFLLAIKVFGDAPTLGREYRIACGVLAILGLIATSIGGFSPLHLLWYFPLSVCGSSLFANRRRLVLKRRLDSIDFNDVDDLKRKIASEVDRYNSEVSDEHRIG